MVKTMKPCWSATPCSRSREKLLDWMRKSDTGANRLQAGLPAGWTEGDKTGTGSHGATVDNAIIWPPGRPPILAAAYLSGSDKPIKALEAAHAEMGRMIARPLSDRAFRVRAAWTKVPPDGFLRRRPVTGFACAAFAVSVPAGGGSGQRPLHDLVRSPGPAPGRRPEPRHRRCWRAPACVSLTV